MEFRTRPKSDFLQVASWEQLIHLTRHWQSDVKFYEEEAHFIQRLISRKLVWLEDDKTVMSLRHLHNKLADVGNRCQSLNKKMHQHLAHLQELYENPFAHDEQIFRDEHAVLEDEITEFTKYFRALKKEVIDLVEYAANNDLSVQDLAIQ